MAEDLMDEEYLSEDEDMNVEDMDLEEDALDEKKLEKMLKSKKFKVKTKKTTGKEHCITSKKSEGKTLYQCDQCGKWVAEGLETKIYKGRNQNYAYCPECTKELYPNYRKVVIQDLNANRNMRDSLARYEKLR